MHPKDRAQMMAYLTRPSMAKGGRVPFGKGKMPVSVALEEIAKEQGTNFKSKKNLQTLLEGKIGYKPNIESLVPSKYPSLKNFIYEESQKPFTNEELKNILGDDLKKFKAQGLTDRQIRDRASDRKIYKNLPAEKKQKKLLREQKRKAARSPEKVALENEKAALNQQKRRGDLPKYHKGIRPENRLWFDFIRSAESKDGYFKFKNFVPQKGKKYNKTETEAITLVDRKGNEFKFKSLIDDVNKFSGYKADDVLLPYKQVEFLTTQGLTKELNKLAGIRPGSRQAVFNVQHIDGIARNPFNVMLTFADQNLAEAGSRRTFNAEFKNADTLAKKKAAVKKFYSRLGPDIATKLGKKEVGTRQPLSTLLQKAGLNKEKVKGLIPFMKNLGIKCSLSNGVNCMNPQAYEKSLNELSEKAAQGDQAAKNKLSKFTSKVATAGRFIKGALGPLAIASEIAIEGGIALNQTLNEGVPIKQAFADSLTNKYLLGPKLQIDKEAEIAKEFAKGEEFAMAERGRRMMLPQSATADAKRQKERMDEMISLYPQYSDQQLTNMLEAAGYNPQDVINQRTTTRITPAVTSTLTGLDQLRTAFQEEDALQRIADAGGVANLAGGGIAGLSGGKKSGPPPISGPTPDGDEGLPAAFKRVKKG